jgi:hypothetical protein
MEKAYELWQSRKQFENSGCAIVPTGSQSKDDMALGAGMFL